VNQISDDRPGEPSGAYYFITQCTYLRESLAGEVVDGRMRLNQYGRIVREEWLRAVEATATRSHPETFAVMPNHFHALLWLEEDGEADGPAAALEALMVAFKAAVAERVNVLRGTPNGRFWQPSYHSHRLRHDRALPSVRRYIENNPADWERDHLNPAVGGQFCPIPLPEAE
jgi:putative transposase